MRVGTATGERLANGRAQPSRSSGCTVWITCSSDRPVRLVDGSKPKFCANASSTENASVGRSQIQVPMIAPAASASCTRSALRRATVSASSARSRSLVRLTTSCTRWVFSLLNIACWMSRLRSAATCAVVSMAIFISPTMLPSSPRIGEAVAFQ